MQRTCSMLAEVDRTRTESAAHAQGAVINVKGRKMGIVSNARGKPNGRIFSDMGLMVAGAKMQLMWNCGLRDEVRSGQRIR